RFAGTIPHRCVQMSPNIFEDFLELTAFAREIKRHPRTVRNWCRKYNLPFARNGKTLLIHVPTYRNWLLNDRMSNQKKARKRVYRMRTASAPHGPPATASQPTS